MLYSHRAFIYLTLVTLGIVTKVEGQVTKSLSKPEKKSVRELLSASSQWQQRAHSATKAPVYLIDIWKYRRGETAVFVKAIHYKYEGGITIRTTIDLNTRNVLKIEQLRAYPTPLIKKEVKRAVTLARANIEAVRAMYAVPDAKQIQVDVLAPVISNRKSQQFGHRLALLTFHTIANRKAISVEVDLTTKTAKLVGKN